jgi:glycosyltransferase involved in cell wall biosynthesis
MIHKISLIVATKDRPNDLRTLLESLRRQTIAPAEIIVVDASRESVDH